MNTLHLLVDLLESTVSKVDRMEKDLGLITEANEAFEIRYQKNQKELADLREELASEKTENKRLDAVAQTLLAKVTQQASLEEQVREAFA